ncbi:hypothetical protein FACS1894202_11210 [Clostridia bacterium]|nr:hypothetical protein FACS1894202_11210 [Clostridia bacterium]
MTLPLLSSALVYMLTKNLRLTRDGLFMMAALPVLAALVLLGLELFRGNVH